MKSLAVVVTSVIVLTNVILPIGVTMDEISNTKTTLHEERNN